MKVNTTSSMSGENQPEPIVVDCREKRLALLEALYVAVGKIVVECNHKPTGWDEADRIYKELSQ